MERKLATIRRISAIDPIPDADAIEVATVDAWKVVVKKGEFNVEDLVIYCEIDSFLPIRPEYEFLRKSSYKKLSDGTEGFRLKTVKLRGQVSQGLILPLNSMVYGLMVGDDVSDILGIVKYEPPIPADLAGKMKGYFPSFIPKTDEERIQNLADEYDSLRSNGLYYATEKLDGSSATFYFKDGEFGVCSRNIELLETEDNTFWKVARALNLEDKLRKYGSNVAIQGECIGEGIQGNPYKIKGQTVKFFNAFDINNQTRYDFYRFTGFISAIGLETVPIIFVNFELPKTIDEVISLADDVSVLNPNTNREGLVIRSLDGYHSFKAISNRYLLKNEK